MLIGRKRGLFFLNFLFIEGQNYSLQQGRQLPAHAGKFPRNFQVFTRFSARLNLTTETLNERVVPKAGMLETWNSKTKARNPKTRIDYICVAFLFKVNSQKTRYICLYMYIFLQEINT